MIFRRRAKTTTTEQEVPAARESSQAREYSEQRLQAVQEAWPEVQAIAGTFRKLRTDNHFAARIREAHQP